MIHPLSSTVALTLAVFASACASSTQTGSGQGSMPPGGAEPTLEEIRTATARFRDVKVALAEGYIPDPGNSCETAEMMGKPAAFGAM